MKDINGNELKPALRTAGGIGMRDPDGGKSVFVPTEVKPEEGINKTAAYAQDCNQLAHRDGFDSMYTVDSHFRSVYTAFRDAGAHHDFMRKQLERFVGASAAVRRSIGYIYAFSFNAENLRCELNVNVYFEYRNEMLRVFMRFDPKKEIKSTAILNQNPISRFAIAVGGTWPEWSEQIEKRFPEIALYAVGALDRAGYIKR